MKVSIPMEAYKRLLHYVTFDTTGDETTGTTPSTPGQLTLGTALVEEGDYGDIEDESGPTMFDFVPIAGSNNRDRKNAERIKKFLR